MPVQCSPRSALSDVPEPDRFVKAGTGQCASIQAPDHSLHPVRMPRERLETAEAFHVPQLDGLVPTRTRELGAIGGEGQPSHPVSMSRKSLHVGARLWYLGLPHPNVSIGAATGEQSPIGAPGQRVHRATLSRKPLYVHAAPRVPEVDEGVIPTTGEEAPIRGKGQTSDSSGLPARPEQSATGNVPQLDRVIPAHAGQLVSIRAESQSMYSSDVGLPDPVQGQACLCPHAHFPSPGGS